MEDFYCKGASSKKAESVYKEAPFYLQVDNTAEEQHLIFGWANVTVNSDGSLPFDWEGDIIPTSVLEDGAYNYVLNFGTAGQRHLPDTECGYLVESMMFTKEKMSALGIPDGAVNEGWWIGFYVPSTEIFQKVKDKTYNMFSIQGSYMKQAL